MNISKENSFKFLTIFATIVGTIIAIASISTLDRMIAIITIALIIVLGIIIWILHFKKRESMPILELERSIDMSLAPEVRTIRNQAELQKIANLNKACYGEHSVDSQGLLGWWMRYPDGINALFHHRVLIGDVSIWPLTKNAFDMLIAGKLKESNIRGDDICEKGEKQIYWYFGNIILERKYWGQNLSFFLLKSAVDAWLKEDILADKVELCAIGATRTGEKLLGKFGFLVAAKSPDGLPIYRRTALVTELREDFRRNTEKGEGSLSRSAPKRG